MLLSCEVILKNSSIHIFAFRPTFLNVGGSWLAVNLRSQPIRSLQIKKKKFTKKAKVWFDEFFVNTSPVILAFVLTLLKSIKFHKLIYQCFTNNNVEDIYYFDMDYFWNNFWTIDTLSWTQKLHWCISREWNSGFFKYHKLKFKKYFFNDLKLTAK